jgi:steroid 5-alpha reductase family enzyme
MQGAWMWLIGQPLLVVFADDAAGGDLGPVDYVACALWLLGFVYEAGSDLQLQLFKKHRQPGQVCDTLFFKYTRHPNYFGDAVVWLSYYLFAAPRGEYGWLALGSPVLMFVLLRYVSGVVINDRVQAERKPHYREYIANTAPFCPWPWGPRLCRCGPPPAAETPIGSSKDEYDRLA